MEHLEWIATVPVGLDVLTTYKGHQIEFSRLSPYSDRIFVGIDGVGSTTFPIDQFLTEAPVWINNEINLEEEQQ